MTDLHREAKLAALRERVRDQLDGEDELVVTSSDVEAAALPQPNSNRLKDLTQWQGGLDDGTVAGLRQFASVVIFLGSALGILSGLLLLQGNPVDLLSTDLLLSERTVDLRMQVLEAESGAALEGLRVEWVDLDSGTVLRSTTTDAYGWFNLEGVLTEARLLRISAEGYRTSELELVPQSAGMPPVTLTPGEGVDRTVLSTGEGQWTLDDAVRLSTTIGVLTIISGAVGLMAGLEVRRGGRYRRTQYLAGLALFSRGLIVFGPALILLGMITTSFAKDQFADVREGPNVPDFR
jgi:hypothetical protein